MFIRSSSRLISICTLVMTLSAAQTAHAQPADPATRATARTIAQEGLDLFDNKRWQEALDKFTRADNLMRTPTVSLLAARCLGKLGRLVEANERYQSAVRFPLAADASAAFKEAVTSAEREQKALAPRIPRLRVGLHGAQPGEVEVTLDGKPLAAAMIGVDRLTDPGPHALRGKRGDEVVEQRFDMKEGQPLAVALAFAGTTPGSTQRVIGWTLVGVGGAGLVASAVTLGLGLDAKSKLVKPPYNCSPELDCLPSATDAVNHYTALRGASIGTLIGGAAALVAGVVVVIAAPRSRNMDKAALVLPWIGPGQVGIEGVF